MKRRKAREYALQFLYRIDFVDVPSSGNSLTSNISELRDAIAEFWTETPEQSADVKSFAEDIIYGTIKNLDEIDSLIGKAAEKWALTRIASIDRNILRFAIYELLFRPDIPTAVTINEALEIAKKYSTADSAAFINGLLDKIAKQSSRK